MDSVKGQLTLRGILHRAASAAPSSPPRRCTPPSRWGRSPGPIVFAAIISLFFLKALGHGKASLKRGERHAHRHERGRHGGRRGSPSPSPGAWMLGHADEAGWLEMLLVALSGRRPSALCAPRFCAATSSRTPTWSIPSARAAAQTLIAGDAGGSTGAKSVRRNGPRGRLHGAARRGRASSPAMFFGNVAIPGVSFGIYNSPMLLAVGFLVGTGAVAVWFAGALLANFGIVAGGSSAGLWDVASAQGIASSLGMGVMMGAGVGVICKNILPKAARTLRGARTARRGGASANARRGCGRATAQTARLGRPRGLRRGHRGARRVLRPQTSGRRPPSSWCCSRSSQRP